MVAISTIEHYHSKKKCDSGMRKNILRDFLKSSSKSFENPIIRYLY